MSGDERIVRHGVLVPAWQRDVWRELTAPVQAALDEVTSLVTDARERACAAAWLLTDEAQRHRLHEIVEPERPPRFTVGLDPARLDSNEQTLVVECDPPALACWLVPPSAGDG